MHLAAEMLPACYKAPSTGTAMNSAHCSSDVPVSVCVSAFTHDKKENGAPLKKNLQYIVVLNSLGLRKRMFQDVMVPGLYIRSGLVMKRQS